MVHRDKVLHGMITFFSMVTASTQKKKFTILNSVVVHYNNNNSTYCYQWSTQRNQLFSDSLRTLNRWCWLPWKRWNRCNLFSIFRAFFFNDKCHLAALLLCVITCVLYRNIFFIVNDVKRLTITQNLYIFDADYASHDQLVNRFLFLNIS